MTTTNNPYKASGRTGLPVTFALVSVVMLLFAWAGIAQGWNWLGGTCMALGLLFGTAALVMRAVELGLKR